MELNAPNINQLWCDLIIEELARQGVEYFCVSPGSRSAPLAVAAARNARARAIVCADERGAAFWALGYARGAGRPAALVCTSGTAPANYFPAVIEASADCVPMIVLSADRPPELLQTGANQTINQRQIFGGYPRWFFELPCPDEAVPPEFALTAVAQAVYQARRAPAGVAHLNCQFREPLAPAERPIGAEYAASQRLRAWAASKEPFTRYAEQEARPSAHCVRQALEGFAGVQKPLVALGELRSDAERAAALRLAARLGAPVFADVLSGARAGDFWGHAAAPVIPFFDQILLSPAAQERFRPDALLHIGGQMTSKRFAQWIAAAPPRHYVALKAHPFRHDTANAVSLRLESAIAPACEALAARLPERPDFEPLSRYHSELSELSAAVEAIVERATGEWEARGDALSEIAVARAVAELTPAGHGVFWGNSMPVRDADMYASPRGRARRVAANRGASGIDGLVASAVGFADGIEAPATLCAGDLSLLHDLSSLALLRFAKRPITIVAINNQGGGIFSFLPVAEFPDVFEPFFAAPHPYSFRHAAEMFGLEYRAPQTRADFERDYRAATAGERHTLLEISSDRARNREDHKRLQDEIAALANARS